MPRVSRAQTDLNKAAIEDVSARLFRERGITAVSVADFMGAAGLTPGGFYGHFASKDELAAVACAKAFAQSHERWSDRTAGTSERKGLEAIVDGYLTKTNRDNPGDACPSACLAVDVSREDDGAPVRQVYLDGLKEQIATLAALQTTGDARSDRKAAVTQMALLVGAMVLARATSGDRLSDELLSVAKRSLKAAHGGGR